MMHQPPTLARYLYVGGIYDCYFILYRSILINVLLEKIMLKKDQIAGAPQQYNGSIKR